MRELDDILTGIPEGLRDPLLREYSEIITAYMEHRWTAAELSGGRFCEVVYSVLHGYAMGTYLGAPAKPKNMVGACRALESQTHVPRSFQILIPRLLPSIYEIRNNRNVGHVGGDVSPDSMDSSLIVSACSWILAELVRVLHGTSTDRAQQIVNSLVELRSPLVWVSGGMRRVLKPALRLREQILVLIASVSGTVKSDDLFRWTGYKNRRYFDGVLRGLHASRQIEFHEGETSEVELLPPGAEVAAIVVRRQGSAG
jgi:hypothetical protein